MKKLCHLKCTLVVFLVFVMLFVFSGCCSEHDMEVISQTQATCESEGVTVLKCRECDYEESIYDAVTDHTFVEKTVQEASCSSPGVAEKTCTVCNKVETVSIETIPHTYVVTSTKEATAEAPGVEESICSVCGDVQQRELAKIGSSRSNPIKVTVEQLVYEININQDAAKAKYNGQYVEITGQVLEASNVAGMTRFCFYGRTGEPGLRIVCWVNKELNTYGYQGGILTLRGCVREVTTVNATEIGSCEIVTE